jgi:2-polyprenyl-3-methyl-5-hydroxy-6-metoxy-1,4-benzoquinol methylase
MRQELFMNNWKPSENYRKIAEANRSFYTQLADLYDKTEGSVVDPHEQAVLETELDRALTLLGREAAAVRALDACGGSGSVSLKLLRRGAQVTLADISPDLIKIFQEKCRCLGYKPETVCTEIADFLSDPNQTFDLIIFSAALHHLENIEGVLVLAFDRLAPGGLLLTFFDPTDRSQLRRMTRTLQRVDYYVFKILHQSADLPKAIGRRLRRIFAGVSADQKNGVALDASTVGMLAEYHVEKGIDDKKLVAVLCKAGYEVVQHERTAGGRTDWLRKATKAFGDATTFHLVLRKP